MPGKLYELHILRTLLLVCIVCLMATPELHADDKGDQLEFNGDFRYRYELIDFANDDTGVRNRHRIRARFGLEARIAEEARVFFQLASGSDDLVSSNQTLSGTFSSKGLVLDLAYGEYEPIFLKRRITVAAGKSPLPFFRPGEAELLWDNDLRPEGISANVNLGPDHRSLRVFGGYYILEERKSESNSYLIATQLVGTIHDIPKMSSLKTGIGYFQFTEIKDRESFFRDDFAGNSSYPDTTFPANPSDPPEITSKHLRDYRELELFIETAFHWKEKPILLLADYVVNTESETDDIGWLFGFKLGQVEDRGSWSIRYNYRRVEKDAVYGTFTDSNFGDGGTDSKGHEAGFSFGVFKDTKLTLSYFLNWLRIEDEDKYQRVMLDVMSTF